ncbi:hypothetical protein GW846_04255 [Candidatus Gracilibacteria bacterium]|nr:hypothetical protein [Candidatus Gracilibacteria bacterium]
MNPRLIHKQHPDSHFSSMRKQEKEKLTFGYQSTYSALLGLIGFLLLYYVWILNANATQGYTIRQLEKNQNELKVELDRLNVKIAEIDSLDSIGAEDALNNMQQVEDPNYLVYKSNVQYVFKN